MMVLPGTAALADCKKFDAYSGEPNKRHHNDVDGSGGPSAGDKRFSVRTLTDDHGKPIGAVHFIATLHTVDDDGKVKGFTGDAVFTFDNGTVFTTSEWAPPLNAGFHANERISGKEGVLDQWTVIGGTGAYLDASGMLKRLSKPDGQYDYVFDITCP